MSHPDSNPGFLGSPLQGRPSAALEQGEAAEGAASPPTGSSSGNGGWRPSCRPRLERRLPQSSAPRRSRLSLTPHSSRPRRGSPFVQHFERMGRGRKKANRKFRYLIARMKEVRVRIVPWRGSGGPVYSRHCSKQPERRKSVAQKHRNHQKGLGCKRPQRSSSSNSTPTVGRVQKSGHKKHFHATVQIQNSWHERKTPCTIQQPTGNSFPHRQCQSLRFVALCFVQLEGCLFPIIIFTPQKKAMSQHAAKRESKQADPAEAQGASVAFGSREMQSPLLTVMN